MHAAGALAWFHLLHEYIIKPPTPALSCILVASPHLIILFCLPLLLHPPKKYMTSDPSVYTLSNTEKKVLREICQAAFGQPCASCTQEGGGGGPRPLTTTFSLIGIQPSYLYHYVDANPSQVSVLGGGGETRPRKKSVK